MYISSVRLLNKQHTYAVLEPTPPDNDTNTMETSLAIGESMYDEIGITTTINKTSSVTPNDSQPTNNTDTPDINKEPILPVYAVVDKSRKRRSPSPSSVEPPLQPPPLEVDTMYDSLITATPDHSVAVPTTIDDSATTYDILAQLPVDTPMYAEPQYDSVMN